MSADNGWMIREVLAPTGTQFVLQMYFASADEYPPTEQGIRFDTLEEATRAFAKAEAETDHQSEYGLQIFLLETGRHLVSRG